MKRALFLIATIATLVSLPGMLSGAGAVGSVELTPLPPVEDTDGRAGACFAHYYGPDDRPFLPLAYAAGSRHDRIDFRWDAIHTNGSNDYAGHDSVVDDELAAGIDLIGILMATPSDFRAPGCDPGTDYAIQTLPGQRPPGWYRPEPGGVSTLHAAASDPGACPPAGLYSTWSTGDFNGNHWAKFVYETVSHYADRVKHWEMWNEPDWNYFWLGTSTDYARLLKVGYRATKAACPDCTVLFGGLHYWINRDFSRWVLNTVNDDPDAPQNNYFFDVMSVHLYSRSSNAYDTVNDLRDSMTDFVPDHPIWLTETGVPVWDDASVDPHPDEYDYAATRDEAAAYVIQSYANAWASGVERYFFFRTHDADMVEYFGLVRNDLSIRPSYVAYQVATTYLISPAMTTSRTHDQGVRQVTLWGTPRGKVSVLWNATPQPVEFDYAATRPTATLVNRRGVTQTIEASDDVYRLQLPGATANLVSNPSDYFIGGQPYLIIEDDMRVPDEYRTVNVDIGSVFGDQSGDGSQDDGEPTLDGVSFRFVDAAGAEIRSQVGASWEFTETLEVGEYRVLVSPPGWPSLPPGWLPRSIPVSLPQGVVPVEVERDALGLLPHRTSRFFPIIAHNS